MVESDRKPLVHHSSPSPRSELKQLKLTRLATLDSLLDLMRRLPPTRVEENVNALCEICPEYADDLLGNVDQPLKVLSDPEKGREFLGCDYNRDGDSFRFVPGSPDQMNGEQGRNEAELFRSPWSNAYLPESSGGPVPSPKLRQLETSLNAAFDTYREMYFEGGVSSVYLWDLEDEPSGKEMSFAGVVLMKKSEPSLIPPNSPLRPVERETILENEQRS